jgi:hypothetical protein
MYESEAVWRDVDRYFIDMLVAEDQALAEARRSSAETTMPQTEVAANQGELLALLVGMVGGRRVLEFGTLAATARSGWPVPSVEAARSSRSNSRSKTPPSPNGTSSSRGSPIESS